jgi:hypothetical protein
MSRLRVMRLRMRKLSRMSTAFPQALLPVRSTCPAARVASRRLVLVNVTSARWQIVDG